MPYDGSGQYNLPVTTVTPAVSTTTIDSSDFNTFTADLETALSLCITNDGQTSTPRINLPNINEAVNMTATSTELNLLDGAAVTTDEINNVDGDTAATSTTVAAGDRVVYNDDGAMVQVDVDDIDTYFSATAKTLTNKKLGSGYGGGATISGAVLATTSGASADFTSIPSWVKKITVIIDQISSTSNLNIVMTIGDSGGLETTGYISNTGSIIPTTYGSTANFTLGGGSSVLATSTMTGVVELINITGNTWIAKSILMDNIGGIPYMSIGSKTLTGTLDRLSVFNLVGTLDNGQVNIQYE